MQKVNLHYTTVKIKELYVFWPKEYFTPIYIITLVLLKMTNNSSKTEKYVL